MRSWRIRLEIKSSGLLFPGANHCIKVTGKLHILHWPWRPSSEGSDPDEQLLAAVVFTHPELSSCITTFTVRNLSDLKCTIMI